MKKRNNKLIIWLSLGIVCIALGLIVFKNYPDFGKWIVGFGSALMILTIFKKSKSIQKQSLKKES